jgi:hypothetical protein
VTRIRVRNADGDFVGNLDAPVVYEGMRVQQRIKGKRFNGTVTRVSTRRIRVVYDDGMTMEATFRKDVGPCLPGPGTWKVFPWKTRKEAT